jgi:LysM domain
MIAGLKRALIVSAGLNLLLMIGLIYLLMREKPPAPYFELKPAGTREQATPLAIDRSNADMLRQMRLLPMEQLIAKLADQQLVENGFKQRDLALASLVAFHQFDLSRALLGLPQPEQQRSVVYGRLKNGAPALVILYPSLSEEQFQAIQRFARTEKWPMTSHGLFLALRKKLLEKQTPDPTLVDAFFLTPEFLSIEMIFNRCESSVEKQELLTLLYEGDWKTLATFAEQQRAMQDLSSARRQRLLLDYIEHGSRTAAYLILKTDGDFAAHKLDDPHVMAILRLLPHKTHEAETFALAQLTSPRSDAVWKMAARRLYAYAGEQLPDSDPHQAAMERFAGKAKPAAPPKTAVVLPLTKPKPTKAIAAKETPKKAMRQYLVQEGDSLWKIARRFKVEIATLKKVNKLESDLLRPGTTLQIP